MLILADMPILKASKILRCNEKSLTRILRHWVKKAVDEDKLGDVSSLAIDETSFVSSDLSASYRSGIRFCFPQAKHTVDKFHVKKLLLDAMDEVRRSEQQSLRLKNKINRKLLMIPERKD